LIVRRHFSHRRALVVLAALAPLFAGCSSTVDMFSSDLLSRDAAWFSRSGRLFIKNVSIETPPLTPDKPVTPDDLISADGMCPGMNPPPGPSEANALSDNDAAQSAPPSRPGVVALGHTECDVARGAGMPNSVSISANERGDRVALLTYASGPRAGIYTFTSGRLSSIERGPEPVGQPKAAKPKAKKKHAAT